MAAMSYYVAAAGVAGSLAPAGQRALWGFEVSPLRP